MDEANRESVGTNHRFFNPFNKHIHAAHALCALGPNVVAEGVKNHEQLQYLSSIGCDSIQGFAIGRPEPSERCLASIEKINGMQIYC